MPKRQPVTQGEIDQLRAMWQEALTLMNQFISDCLPEGTRGYRWIDEDVFRVWRTIKLVEPAYDRVHHYRRWYQTELIKIQQLIDLRPNWDEIAVEADRREAEAQVNRERNQIRFADIISLLEERSENSPFCADMVTIFRNSGEAELSDIFTPRQLEVIVEIWGKYAGADMPFTVGSADYSRRVAEFRERFEASATD